MRIPMLCNIVATTDPYLVMALYVIHKALQGFEASRTSKQATVHAN